MIPGVSTRPERVWCENCKAIVEYRQESLFDAENERPPIDIVCAICNYVICAFFPADEHSPQKRGKSNARMGIYKTSIRRVMKSLG
jgi:hypothetical protein